MQSISSTLQAHQRASRRNPHVLAAARAERARVQILRWQRLYSGAEPNAPHALTLAADGALIRARNASGTLYTSRVASPGPASSWSSWTSTATGLLSGSGVALALSPSTGELLLAYTTGTALLARTSSNNGATWSSAVTVVTEASNIGAIAAAFNPAGNAAVFYTLGTSTTLKRIRRTSGTWAGSGTSWSRSSSVASLTGVAATHDNSDFQLVVTGTEVTTGHPRAWGALMGDLGLPTNAWSTLLPIAEADAASGTTYAAPFVARDGKSALRATFAITESGNVPFTRAFEAAASGGLGTSPWTEPTPHEATGSLALAFADDAAWAATPSGVWMATLPADDDFTARLVTARYRITPDSARCVLELDNTDGLLGDPAAFPALFPGAALDLRPGYGSDTGGAPEYGVWLTFVIDRLTYRTAGGRRTLRVDASAGWELLARWHAPQAWQVNPGVTSRGNTFARIAHRAGVNATDGGASVDWSAYDPSFVLAAGESAASALRRLIAVVPDGVRSAEFDGITILDLDPAGVSTETYGPTGHPLTALELIDEPPAANWLRLQGPDRYADQVDFESVYQHGPLLRTLRSLDASSNSRVIEGAEAALRRDTWSHVRGQLVAPFNAATQLFDVVTVDGQDYRVAAIGLDYARGPKGARYDTTLDLADL